MKIRKISIRHVKGIPELDIEFKERVVLLHGANGIGKSTILDCVALLGHLATMYRLVAVGGTAVLYPPALHTFLKGRPEVNEAALARMNSVETTPPLGHQAVRNELEANSSIDRWFEDSYRRTPRVRYECEIDLDGIARVINLVVAFTGSSGLTVSHVLNRTRCDDLAMASHLLLMLEGDESVMNAFLEHQSATSTSIVTDDKGEITQVISPDQSSTMVRGNRVVAINTDLADLGKRDQIRESVKDITLHLGDEIIRLNLPFDEPLTADGGKFRFRFFKELQTIISRVITDPAASKQDNLVGPFLSLVGCDLIDGRPRIDLRRRDEEHSRGTDFMSAGENECFFVFLALLGIDLVDSIVILDEPELHIAEYSRPIFFEELYALTKARNSQVIIATHSLFAMTERESFQFLVVDRVVEPGGKVRYACGTNADYSLRLFKAYWRTGTLFLGTAGSTRPFRALGSALASTIDRLGRARPVTMAFFVSVLSTAMCALGSDLLNFVNLQSRGEHILIIRFIFGYGGIAAFAFFVMFWARKRRR